MADSTYKPETMALHAGHTPDSDTLSRAVPIYQTSSFLFQDAEHAASLFALEEPGNIYTRIGNPTTAVLENRIAALEGGAGALAVSSGQAATTLSLLNILEAGDEFLSSANLYGGTHTLFSHTFAQMGIKVRFTDPGDPENFRRALKEYPKCKAVFAETLGNPKLDALDISAVSSIVHEFGIPLIVDNTVPSPFLCNPLAFGADIVMHSTTKFIGGHGTSIGGIIVDGGKFDWANGKFPRLTEPDPSYHGLKYREAFGDLAYITKARVTLLRDLGPAMSPMNAFLFLQGLETLPLRMERHSQNAQAVAEFLEKHPAVAWVNYPGLPGHSSFELAKKYFPRGMYSGLMGFGIKGGLAAGKKLIESVKLLSHLANIGDAKSLVIHPATTTHQQLTKEERLDTGVTDDFVRLSVGIEHIDDILADLDQALASSQK